MLQKKFQSDEENPPEEDPNLILKNLQLKQELKKKEIIFSVQKEKLESQLIMMKKHFETMQKRQQNLLNTQRKQILEIEKSEISYSKGGKGQSSDSKILIENEIGGSDFELEGLKYEETPTEDDIWGEKTYYGDVSFSYKRSKISQKSFLKENY